MSKQKEAADKKFSHVPIKGSWEIPRKTFHYSIGRVDMSIFFLSLVRYTERWTNVPFFFTGFLVLYIIMHGVDAIDVYPILTVILCVVGSAEVLRFNFDWFNEIYCYLLGPLMRPSEVKTRINGVVYYLLGKQPREKEVHWLYSIIYKLSSQ